MKNDEEFDMLAAAEEAAKKQERAVENVKPKSKYTPFDFINAVSETKRDIILRDEDPAHAEKLYNPYIVNKGMSFHSDTILHANEMNMRHNLFKDAQFRYYLGALKSRKRYSKWLKLEKDEDLDLIQKHYQCNRQVAKQYFAVLTPEQLKDINRKSVVGGEVGSKK
jgi:hypothetical protein